MQRILIVTRNYPPDVCGVGDHSYLLKQYWEQEGKTVFVYTASGGNSPGVFRVQPFNEQALNAIQEIVTTYKINLVFWQYVPYSYQVKGVPTWWPKLIRRLQQEGLKQAIFFHEVSLRTRGDGVWQSVIAHMQLYLANKAATMVNHSFTSLPLYQSYFKQTRPLLVPVSSNLPKANLSPAFLPLVMGFANRADEGLLTAFAGLLKDCRARLQLVGKIEAFRKAHLLAAATRLNILEQICFTGTQSPSQLATSLATAWVFIQPEPVRNGRGGVSGKNGTIMAAMQMGLPIVGCAGDMTDRGVFRDGENIIIVPFGDANAYRAVMLDLITDRAKAVRLGQAARATYESCCCWPLAIQKLQILFGQR